ncbi:MAG: hypothetical protein LQ346_001445 [Caloplaca aetnensis]|nr:MAG: hypothetical protein LQ346_001445 [Caloplaca aetnensis]
MGTDGAIQDKGPDGHGTSHITSGPPLKQKRSLTRLFTASRSSSKSRAASSEDRSVPTTPTIPEQYICAPRKASGSSTDCPKTLVQPGLADVAITAFPTNEPPDSGNKDLRGILKPQPKTPKLPRQASGRENSVQPSTLNSVRARRTKASSKRSEDKLSTYHSPSSPTIGKAPVSDSFVNGPSSSPRTRHRGASTASLTLSRLQDAPVKANIPSRPSTSGGESRRGQNKDSDIECKDCPGLGSTFGPFSEPASFNDTEARASFRSAFTSSSSVVGASTARSSVITKDSSMSDVVFELPARDAEDEGMTVDEAIDMYEKGFMDDLESDVEKPNRSSLSEEERRRSMKIAEALNDTIGPDVASFEQTTKSARSEATVTSFPHPFRRESQSGPRLMPPTTTRDQYGFSKASRYITTSQYNSWNSVYVPEQLRRSRKWHTYLREQGCNFYATSLPIHFPDRGPKTARYIRKGIPPAWRGNAWFYYSGGAKLMDAEPDVYSALLARISDLSTDDVESIERDLHRTFPDNIHFKPDHPTHPNVETRLLSSLRRVLQAFALDRPQIGYCQSLNFLAGLLLLFLPEEKTFWMLHVITTDHLPGTHEVSLEGANVDLWVLMLALKENNPSIWAKVGVGNEEVSSIHTARLPPISLCTTSWFMSMFIGTLPIESVLRVWDVIFYEGSQMLFRIALAIFKMGEQQIKDVNDSMELFQVVQSFPRGLLDIGALMGLACRKGFSQEWLNKKRRARKNWYAMEKAKATGPSTAIDSSRSPTTRSSPNLGRANSVWKRRVGLAR